MAVRVVDNTQPSDNIGDGSLSGGGFDFAKWLQQQLAAQANPATAPRPTDSMDASALPGFEQYRPQPSQIGGSDPADPGFADRMRKMIAGNPYWFGGAPPAAPAAPAPTRTMSAPPVDVDENGAPLPTSSTSAPAPTQPASAAPAPFTPTMPTMPPVPTGGQPAAPGPMDPSIIARQKAAAAGSTVAGNAPMPPRKPRPAAPRATAGAGSPFSTFQYQVPGSGYRVAGANHGPLGGNSPIYTALDLSRLFGRG
jgi:hypothetical protein